jgi:hypothetical protein
VYGGGLQVPQIRDWHCIVVNIPADKDRSATTPSLTVRPVANIVSEQVSKEVDMIRRVSELNNNHTATRFRYTTRT